MARLLEALRRDPDGFAIAVLCLMLGIAQPALHPRAIAFGEAARTGIHELVIQPGDAVVTALHDKLSCLPDLLCLPELPEMPSLADIGR